MHAHYGQCQRMTMLQHWVGLPWIRLCKLLQTVAVHDHCLKFVLASTNSNPNVVLAVARMIWEVYRHFSGKYSAVHHSHDTRPAAIPPASKACVAAAVYSPCAADLTRAGLLHALPLCTAHCAGLRPPRTAPCGRMTCPAQTCICFDAGFDAGKAHKLSGSCKKEGGLCYRATPAKQVQAKASAQLVSDDGQ